MAEAFGIASAVFGLVPVCYQAFELVEAACTANEGAEKQVQRIRMQRGLFTGWAECWDLKKSQDKLQSHFRNSDNGPLVVKVILNMSQLFASSDNLSAKYGLKVKLKDRSEFALATIKVQDVLGGKAAYEVGPQVKKLGAHMSWLRRAKFAIREKKKFDELISDLDEHNSTLRGICSEIVAWRIHLAMTCEVLQQNHPGNLNHLAETARDISSESPKGSVRQKRFDLIATTAEFKKRLQNLDQVRPTTSLSKEHFRYGEPRWYFNESSATFAIDTRSNTCCYIEWKTYGEDADAGVPTERDVQELAKIFLIKDPPRSFKTLPCLGAFKDARNSRYGFVYKPPAYIEKIPNKQPDTRITVSQARKPATLLEVLDQANDGRSWVLELGARFAIAKTLVQSLFVLHLTGWVHKNVRSGSVLFLPAESRTGGQPSQSLAKDFKHPYLSGFTYSRAMASTDTDYTARSRTVQRRSIKLDNYHHPEKRMHPSKLYRPAFDIYS
ncbi:hypothetical protein, variant [Cladophialophora immunda]|nr:hypothetical protein, variant [Cladophialophora immunda]KIW30087.1 hypothetical protein, variant [Cladophialophora immunda]OQV06153.1 hypothetical protein CLAIMM_10771 [Cladophialophora immunda]